MRSKIALFLALAGFTLCAESPASLYDKANDVTWYGKPSPVALKLPVGTRTDHTYGYLQHEMRLRIACPGKNDACPSPIAAILSLDLFTKRLTFYESSITLIVDGERIPLESVGRPDVEVLGPGELQEQLAAKVPIPTLRRLVASKEAEIVVGAYSFPVTESNRAALADTVSHIRTR